MCDRMGIDVWDVVRAAATNPFGFMPFYPGPGLGGHCIPIDPFYLSWRARAFGVETKFIELAGEVNRNMPQLVIQKLAESLSARQSRSINGAKILIAGIAYKKNVDDLRESPALHIMEELQGLGANIAYYEPYIPTIPMTREHGALYGMKSVGFDEETIARFDAVLITTDHSHVDYNALGNWSRLVVDTRNATRLVSNAREKIIAA
jgi:UDP-N-acetyl-D-glucosamine dehydrogenase